MTKIKVLGIDCSLNNLGLCICEVDPHLNMTVLETKLIKNDDVYPAKMLKSFQDFNKSKKFAKALREIIGENKIQICVGEIPCGSQSSRACTSAGIVTGLLGSIASYCPVCGVTPIQAKKASVGCNTATKEDVIAWVQQTHPEVIFRTRKLHGEDVVMKDCEHEADSIAIVTAGLLTPEFQQLMMYYLSSGSE